MTWLLWFVPLAALAGYAAWAISDIAHDWARACNKLVAPWRDADPCENKPRKRVWFP